MTSNKHRKIFPLAIKCRKKDWGLFTPVECPAPLDTKLSNGINGILTGFNFSISRLSNRAFLRGKTAFSLIEIVIAMAIMVVGVIGVLELFPIGLSASKKGEIMTRVAFLGQMKLEEIKLAGYEAISASEPDIPLEGNEDGYGWSIFIEEVEIDGLSRSDEIRKVVVTIDWMEKGQTRNKGFITYVAP